MVNTATAVPEEQHFIRSSLSPCRAQKRHASLGGVRLRPIGNGAAAQTRRREQIAVPRAVYGSYRDNNPKRGQADHEGSACDPAYGTGVARAFGLEHHVPGGG
jgi:hypothetical protein